MTLAKKFQMAIQNEDMDLLNEAISEAQRLLASKAKLVAFIEEVSMRRDTASNHEAPWDALHDNATTRSRYARQTFEEQDAQERMIKSLGRKMKAFGPLGFEQKEEISTMLIKGCPSNDCQNFEQVTENLYRRKGFLCSKDNGIRTQRFQCKICNAWFTANPLENQHRPELTRQVFFLVGKGATIDQMSKELRCNPITVARKVRYLALQSKEFHEIHDTKRISIDLSTYPSKKNSQAKEDLAWILSAHQMWNLYSKEFEQTTTAQGDTP